jgi:hypothetical protein
MSADDRRLRFERAELHGQTQGLCRVDVAFTFCGRTIEASAAAGEGGSGPLRAAVTATLSAVEQAAAGRFTCSLADIDHVTALGKALIAVLVDINFEGKQLQVFGSCQIAGSEIDVAVKAALNATNRFVELALEG